MKFKEYLPLSILIFLANSILILVWVLNLVGTSFVFFGFFCLFFAWLSFKRPQWAFWFFVAFLPLESIVLTPENFPISLRPYQIVGGILSAVAIFLYFQGKLGFRLMSFRKICLVCKLLKKGGCSASLKQKSFGFLDRIIFVLPLFALLGILVAPDRAVAIKGFLVLLSFVVLFWLVRNFLQSGRQKLEALWFFCLGAVPVIIFGIYQAVAFKLGRESFQVFEGRINGTFSEPDWFGMFLVFLFAVELWCLLLLNLSQNTTMIGKIKVVLLGKLAAYTDLFLISALIFLTVSRSAWIAAGAVVLVYGAMIFWFSSKKKQALASFLLLLAVGVVALLAIVQTGLFTFHFGNRAASSVTGMQKITISCQSESSKVPEQIEVVEVLEKYSCRHIDLEEIETEKEAGNFVKEVYRPDPNVDIRKEIYRQTWAQIKGSPLLGIGVGSSAVILGSDSHGSGYNASNIFLEIWLSLGIFGFLLFAFLVAFLPIKLAKNIFEKPDSKTAMRFGAFGMLTFGAIVIPNLFNSGLLIGFLWAWLALIISFIHRK